MGNVAIFRSVPEYSPFLKPIKENDCGIAIQDIGEEEEVDN